MNEIKLSDDVLEQIKDFDRVYTRLTEEQKSLIDKLITNKELKERYIINGLCGFCRQPETGRFYCWACNSQRFKQDFKNWTSGNHVVDEFIQKAQLKAINENQILEWIEYDKFEDVEYLSKGGFGTTFKAVWKGGYIRRWDHDVNQWKRTSYTTEVALKFLNNSQGITADFLKEVESNNLVYNDDMDSIVRCYGITKDPKTNNFMMVMDLKHRSLRQHLDNYFISTNWYSKLWILRSIASGLKDIHNKGLIHRDFHSGNILTSHTEGTCAYITDLGLCQPANVKSNKNSNKKIYGVLPYVDPEVLRGKEYTQASDIYGYGIIAYEICTGHPPYYNIAHDGFLAIRICQGLRPKSNYKTPQLIFDIINQCWDADPLKRPNANELFTLMNDLWDPVYWNKVDSVIYKQLEETDNINKKLSFSMVQSPLSSASNLLYTTHPQAVYTSKLLDFKNLPESKNADNDDMECSDFPLTNDFTKLNINYINCKDEEIKPIYFY